MIGKIEIYFLLVLCNLLSIKSPKAKIHFLCRADVDGKNKYFLSVHVIFFDGVAPTGNFYSLSVHRFPLSSSTDRDKNSRPDEHQFPCRRLTDRKITYRQENKKTDTKFLFYCRSSPVGIFLSVYRQ